MYDTLVNFVASIKDYTFRPYSTSYFLQCQSKGHHYTETNRNNVNKTWILLQTTGEELEDTNEEIRIRKSKKDRKHNDQKKKDKQRSTKT
jgi:hypothetical protein